MNDNQVGEGELTGWAVCSIFSLLAFVISLACVISSASSGNPQSLQAALTATAISGAIYSLQSWIWQTYFRIKFGVDKYWARSNDGAFWDALTELLSGPIRWYFWLWDKHLCPFADHYKEVHRYHRKVKARKQALKKLGSVQTKLYAEYEILEEKRQRLLNDVRHCQDVTDRDCKTTQEELRKEIRQLEKAQTKLAQLISPLPLDDLSIQVHINESRQFRERALDLVNQYDDPDVRKLLSNESVVTSDELEQARQELKQQ